MLNYEVMVILSPALSSDKVAQTVEGWKSVLSTVGGELVSWKEWGLKDLQYPIQNSTRGLYLLLDVVADSQCLDKLTWEMKINVEVLRHLVLRKEKKNG